MMWRPLWMLLAGVTGVYWTVQGVGMLLFGWEVSGPVALWAVFGAALYGFERFMLEAHGGLAAALRRS